ncbi:hypothetical protein ACL7C8_15200 [Bordetella pertussis]
MADFAARARDTEWNRAAISALIKAVLADRGLKMPQLGIPLRVAVTGRAQTPAVDAVLELLGKETVLARAAGALTLMPPAPSAPPRGGAAPRRIRNPAAAAAARSCRTAWRRPLRPPPGRPGPRRPPWPMNRHDANQATAVPRAAGTICVALVCKVACSR